MKNRKKKKPLPPRCKRTRRPQRLQSAKRRLETFEGENVIRAYRKHYGVDWQCTIKELKLLGVSLEPGYVQELEQTVEAQIKANRKRKLERQRADEETEWNNRYPYSDDNFYFIAGYTSGGAPYGITWEQAERKGLLEDEG